jgi:hypothetical protein
MQTAGLFLVLAVTTAYASSQNAPLPANYHNDLYHCFLQVVNNLATGDDSVACDTGSYQWIIANLNPDQPPTRCDHLDLLSVIPDSTDDDSLEPCILWQLKYGFLGSIAPTDFPSDVSSEVPTGEYTDVPSSTATKAPSSDQPSTTPSVTPTDTPTESPSAVSSTSPSLAPSEFVLENKPSVTLAGVSLSFWVVPAIRTRMLRRQLQTDINQDAILEELQDHIKTYLSESLSMELLAVVLTINYSVSVSEKATLSRFDGSVYFREDEVRPSASTVDLLTNAAFKGPSLDALMTSFNNNPQLAYIKQIKLEDEAAVVSSILANKNSKSDSAGGLTSTMMIVYCGIGAGVLCIAFLSSFLFVNRKRADPRADPHADLVKNNTELTSPRSADPENGQDFPDSQSDSSSVYSYIKDEGSVSIAPSYMYALNEQSFDNSEDDESLLTPTWGTEPESPRAAALMNVQRHVPESAPSSPSRSFVMTDDENSTCSTDLERVLDVEKFRPPIKRSFKDLWKEGGDEPRRKGITEGTVPMVIVSSRPSKDPEFAQHESHVPPEAETLDWKLTCISSDEQDHIFVPDESRDKSLADLSNIEEVTVATEGDYVVPEFLFQAEYSIECNSDDKGIYETDEEAEKGGNRLLELSFDTNVDVSKNTSQSFLGGTVEESLV